MPKQVSVILFLYRDKCTESTKKKQIRQNNLLLITSVAPCEHRFNLYKRFSGCDWVAANEAVITEMPYR